MPGDTGLEPVLLSAQHQDATLSLGTRENGRSSHVSQLPSHTCSDLMFMLNALSPPSPSEASLSQTVCLEDRLLYQNKTVLPRFAVDKAGHSVQECVWSQKDHALIVFSLNPFLSAKTFLSSRIPGPSFFSHLCPLSAHQQCPHERRGP